MKGDPVQRAVLLGEYIVQHGATVRAAAAAFGYSKSTVHKDVAFRLRAISPGLYARCGRCWPAIRPSVTCGAAQPPGKSTRSGTETPLSSLS